MGIVMTGEYHFEEAKDKIERTAKERLEAACIRVHKEASEILVGQRSGRQYYVPGTGTRYTASAPGEPPASRTGLAGLRGHISWEMALENGDPVGLVGTDVKYGPMLEFGTKTIHHVSLNTGEKVAMGSTSMAARPWLRPAFEKSEPAVKAIMEKPWLE